MTQIQHVYFICNILHIIYSIYVLYIISYMLYIAYVYHLNCWNKHIILLSFIRLKWKKNLGRWEWTVKSESHKRDDKFGKVRSSDFESTKQTGLLPPLASLARDPKTQTANLSPTDGMRCAFSTLLREPCSEFLQTQPKSRLSEKKFPWRPEGQCGHPWGETGPFP